MKRPKIEDFKIEYTKGIAEIASVRKQYSKAQDLYIDHLEQLLIYSVVVPNGTCCEPVDEGFYLGTSCPKCNKPFRQNLK